MPTDLRLVKAGPICYGLMEFCIIPTCNTYTFCTYATFLCKSLRLMSIILKAPLAMFN